jgi:hypothetical protein
VPAARGRAWPPAANGGAGPDDHGVTLRYRERGPVLVRGPVTGRPYEFSAAQPTRSVDARDAEVLLRTRHFVRA